MGQLIRAIGEMLGHSGRPKAAILSLVSFLEASIGVQEDHVGLGEHSIHPSLPVCSDLSYP